MSDRRFLTDSGDPRAFVVVSSARSGSNLLVSYLRQVRRAACFGEIMRAEFPDKVGWTRLEERLDLPADARRLHEVDLTGWWELVLARGLRKRRWLGAKVFYYHRQDDPVWGRFGAEDHRVIHLWRDATFDQYVSRLLAVESGQWKAPEEPTGPTDEAPLVTFDRDDYLGYRALLRTDVTSTRARYGDTGRYEELEYRQLNDHAYVGDLIERLFGERIQIREGRLRQRPKDKLVYVRNPEVAAPFVDDSISRGFAAET